MKKLITLIFSCVFFQCLGDVGSASEYVSFSELTVKPDVFDNKSISIYGYLKQEGDSIYLCESMEVCFTKDRMRLKVKISGELKDNLLDKLNCHVEMFGDFVRVDESSSYLNRTMIGQLNVNFPPNLSIGDGYLTVNNKCELYNQYVESHGDIGLMK